MKNYNCYIHIPFCTSKCKYCRFASFGITQKLQIQTYVNFLITEISGGKKHNNILDTMYFGGGTPGVLGLDQFKSILNTLKDKYIFDDNIEITIETTPENVTIENIIGWKKLGINRISMGVQTLNEQSLNEIGRAGKGDILNALDNFNEVGFDNVSIDFIIGLPYVYSGEINYNIDFLTNKYNFIKHISVYMLEEYYDVPDEKESNFDNITYPSNWSMKGLKDEDYLREYNSIKSNLSSKGFNQYEISNYSKDGYECRHNIGYWTHKQTIAYGLGAHGYLDNYRYSNSEFFLDYYNYRNITKIFLNDNDIFIEKIMFMLRTGGIQNQYIKYLNKNKIEQFVDMGYLVNNNDKIKLSDKSVVFMDYILGEII